MRSWTTFKNNIVEFFGLHLGLDHIVFGREIIQGIGIVGNAILSNMPITACTRHIVHGKRKRSVLQALVKKKLQLITTHLEPYDHIVRERQMKALLHVHHSSLPTLIAGDLNSIPLGAMQKKMLGYGKNDYSGDQTLKLLIRSRRFHTVQPLFDYIAGKPTILDKKFFTFPTAGYTPNRVLDYILASQDIKFLTYTTQYMHDTDHALLYADVKI